MAPNLLRDRIIMTSNKINSFTWNDLVVIKANVPLSYFPGKMAVICGMEQVKSEKLSNKFNIKIGDWLYTVEFGDGSSIEIPEAYLEKYSETLNIKKYTAYFHDGSLIDIQHSDNKIVLSLESAEMDSIDMEDDISLSERGTIKGKLHLEEVQSIKINDSPFHGKLKLFYDYGSIFDFDIRNNIVELQISWRNSPQKPFVNDFSTIIIEAKKIWWENIPELFDPFW